MLADRQTGPGAAAERAVSLRGFIERGRIGCERSLAEVGDLIAQGRVVVLKGVFPPDRLIDYRGALMRWRAATPPYPNGRSPDATPEVNYHRADTGAIASSIPHIFNQYGLNTFARLPDPLGTWSSSIADSMLDLQNAVAGTDFAISPTGMRVKLLHYPSGGGFLTEHRHPREPQRVGLVLSLSRLGVDCQTGGTAFATPFGPVDTAADHDIGDIILFRYDLPHAVTPIDESQAIDWHSPAGKWSFVLELRDTFGRSQLK